MVQMIITKKDLIELTSEKLGIDAEFISIGENFSLIIMLDIDEVNYKEKKWFEWKNQQNQLVNQDIQKK